MAYLKPAHTTKSLAAVVCRVGFLTVALAVLLMAAAVSADAGNRRVRLSTELSAYLDSAATADIEAILTCSTECVERLVNRHGLRLRTWLSSGAVVSASKRALESLSQDGEIESVSGNAIVRPHMAITTLVTGAQKAWAGEIAALGGPVDGRGIGVAIIDSGIAVDHPALANRVVVSVDFTDPRGRGHDVYGHGTHIAGIVAARGYQQAAAGADSGMAPAAHLINLKVLGNDGSGEAAAVVEAIDWAVRHRTQFGIRVVNLSLGAAPTQSYKDDPICLAVERAVKAGLVVVASAGNYGQGEDGKLVFASVTSPGISPYAITVGATRTQGTVDPLDDEIAPWSWKGPTLVDHLVKPDLVAPGSKIVSTAVKGSVLSNLLADRFVDGPGARDYVAMSGTSMAAAVVSGAAALVLDGQGDLTPLQVKLALQGSADFLPQAGLLTSGAGVLDLSDLDELTSSAQKWWLHDRLLDLRTWRLVANHRLGRHHRLGRTRFCGATSSYGVTQRTLKTSSCGETRQPLKTSSCGATAKPLQRSSSGATAFNPKSSSGEILLRTSSCGGIREQKSSSGEMAAARSSFGVTLETSSFGAIRDSHFLP